MRLLAFVLATGCASSPTPEPTFPELTPNEPSQAAEPSGVAQPIPVADGSTSTCRVWVEEGMIEWTLDSLGRPIARYENSDAAGAQWSSRWERDAQGRTTRIETEMLEGMGAETGEGDTLRELAYRTEADGSVVASYESLGATVRERWTYDGQGRPTRLERRSEGEEPRVHSCTYDARGRVVARDGWRYGYAGERAVPSTVGPPGGPQASVVAFGDVLFAADPEEPYRIHRGLLRYEGDCTDVFFEPCSPVFAPPAPDRWAPRLPVSSDGPLESMEEVVLRQLDCGPADDPEDRCTIERTERAQTAAEGHLREVALVTIARGASGFMSTHLLMRVTEGWWLGPELADGPFVGNQMVGTLQFSVSEVSLRSVDPEEDGPALVARYETETMHETEGSDRAVRESGFIVCLGLGDSQLRCARVPERIEQSIDGEEATTASAELTFVGDGTIGVAQVTGSHDRVPKQSFPIEWLFD